jgi:1-aminocyclopropane-1-carboxylate deaminase
MDLWMKRDDLIHPVVSGNKWRKLKGFFSALEPSDQILTFGGAHSNHLLAAACAANIAGVQITGVVRGEELNPNSNPVLSYCHEQGMKLIFVTRQEYREYRELNFRLPESLLDQWNALKAHILPEGGAGAQAMEGCGDIWHELPWEPDHFVLASGTATTVLGILSAMPPSCATQVHVVSAVKGAKREQRLVEQLAQEKQIQLFWEEDFTFGGFGHGHKELRIPAESFKKETGISLDLNYNAKVWTYLKSRSLSGRVLWLHTGGTALL